MNFSTPSFKRIMLILSPCAALSSFDARGVSSEVNHPANYTEGDNARAKYRELKNNGKTCVLMLASDTCGHCRSAAQPFIDVARRNPNVEFVKLKSSENGDLMDQNGFNGVPSFITMKDGEVKQKHEGFPGEEGLQQMANNHEMGDSAMQESDDMQSNVETKVTVKNDSIKVSHDEGMLAKVQAFFVGLFDSIKNVFVRIFDWIKGLFNR